MSKNVREVRQLLKLAQSQGFTVELRKTGHFKVIAPTGAFTFISGTPSDFRAIPRIKRDLIAIGVVIT